MTEYQAPYSTRDVMRLLRIAQSTVYRYVSEGVLHPVSHRRKARLKFDPEEIYRVGGLMPIPKKSGSK
jgi:predicted site-specific integrase-resolvase